MNKDFYNSVKNELFSNILPYWDKFSRDLENPGFYGEIDNDNIQNKESDRSIVMTSRFLWTYSTVARLTKNSDFLQMADFAYDVICKKYWDKNNHGVFWSIFPKGNPCVSKKQIYGEAFCCYGLSEYAAALKELRNDYENAEKSMNLAVEIFDLIEKYALDKKNGGYLEALAEDWKPTNDLILSDKDMNCPKSMNTNLHVMEAYTNLYRTLPVVFADKLELKSRVANSLKNLVSITVEKILQKNAHLGLFFDMDWNLLETEISYGHDIEASWLLWEAAEELKDESLKSQIRETVLKIAQVALEEGTDKESGAMENFLKDGIKDRTRVWWNQAEALNGFYNAWEMTGDEKYKNACLSQWDWIINHQVDKIGGEWWANIDVNGNPDLKEPKGGNWKTSYHSARGCMELLRRSNFLA